MSKSIPRSASHSRFFLLTSFTLLALVVFTQQMFMTRRARAASSSVVISQVYGPSPYGRLRPRTAQPLAAADSDPPVALPSLNQGPAWIDRALIQITGRVLDQNLPGTVWDGSTVAWH